MALAEWEQVLGAPVDLVLQLVTERSERATRLRQSSPFAGSLTEAERQAVYESYITRTYHPGRRPEIVRAGLVARRKLTALLRAMPLDDAMKASSRCGSKLLLPLPCHRGRADGKVKRVPFSD